MHYFKFNVGNYYRHTHNLTLMEDLAYRRMLDKYYLNENPLPNDVKKIARLVGMRDHEEEIKLILEDFFTLSECGQLWQNETADKVIDKYQADADTARENGKKGGRPRKETQNKPSGLNNKTQSQPNGNPEITESKANNKQLTTNNEQLTINNIKNIEPTAQVDSKQIESDFDIYWLAGMAKNNKKKAFALFKKLADRNGGSYEFATMLADDVKKRLASGQMGFEAMHPTTYLNNERWTDEIKQHQASGQSLFANGNGFFKGVDQSGFCDDSNVIDGFTINQPTGYIEND